MAAEKNLKPKCYKCGSIMPPTILAQHLITTRDGRAIVCQNVPIHRCPNDGEVYFSAAIARIFDRIRQGRLTANDIAVVELPAVSVQQLLAAAG